jgi:hypothetical protein
MPTQSLHRLNILRRTAAPVAIVSGLTAAALLGLSAPRAIAQKPPVQSATWVEHHDPTGFAVRHPAGWVVSKSQDGHILIASPDKTTFALIKPFFLQKTTTAVNWIGDAVTKMTAVFPGGAIRETKQIHTRPDDVAATLTFSTSSGPAQANLLCSIYGPSGMLFAVAAPRSAFAAKRPMLIGILRTFHTIPPTAAPPQAKQATAGAPDADIKYVIWKDPKEGSFTEDVPSGWKVEGGLTHPATIDTRPQTNLTSPDGLTHLQAGDARIGTFSVPTQTDEYFAKQGNKAFEEGQTIHLANGFTNIRYHYISGAEFSQRLVQNTYAQQHPGLQVIATKDLGSRPAQGTPPFSYSTGMTEFTYTEMEQHICGFVLVTTRLLSGVNGVGGIWNCSEILVGTGPDKPNQRSKMMAILEHIQASFKYDPTWQADMWRRGYAETQAYAEAGRRTMEEMNKQAERQMEASREAYRQQQEDRRERIRQEFEEHEAAKSENTRHFTNYILGVTDVRDPNTGATYKVEAGHNYYWADPLDQNNTSHVVGTDLYQRPDINFSPLEEW